jgi:hypothetical protein
MGELSRELLQTRRLPVEVAHCGVENTHHRWGPSVALAEDAHGSGGDDTAH